MERTYYIPRGCTNQNFRFFYLKKLISSFDFPKILLSPLARFDPGFQSPLVHFCSHVCPLSCCMHLKRMCCLCFVFSFVLLRLFFCFVFTKLVVHFFDLFPFCMLLTVWICVVNNQLCTHLLAGLIFVFACAFAGLSNFL